MKAGLLIALVLVGLGVAESKEHLVHTPTPKTEQIQNEILAAMKDSGVLNEWKDKLDDLLYEGNDIETEVKPQNHLTKQEERMLISFVDEYTIDKNIRIPSSLILDIVRRSQKAPSPNLPQIFVQLTPLIDVLSALSKKTTQLNQIIDRQGPVFESPAKTKDILHTLTENLKSELVRLTLETPSTKTKAAPPPRKAEKKEKGGLDLNDYLTLGSTLLKGGNAGQILSLLSGSSDMSSMLALLPQLMESGNYQDILNKMIYGYLDSTPYGPMVKNVLDGYLTSDQGKSTLGSAYQYLELFMKSESGRRMAKVIPKLTAAKNMESFLEIVHEEAEWNWAQVFDNIENIDYKEKTLQQLAGYIVQAYEFVTSPPKGSALAKLPILLNGFLISNGVPAFDSKRPTDSIIAIINKGVKLFSTVKLDVSPHINMVAKTLSKAFDRQAKGNKLSDLTTTQRTHLLARLMDTELVEPLQAVWTVYSHSVKNLKCAQHLLCQVNFHERFGGVESRIAVVKASSLGAAWALAHVKEKTGQKYWTLYKQAVWAGTNGEDCMSQYKVKDKACNVFSWQQSQFMSTGYEHVEL